jgi:anti-anti-sigma factor
MPAITSKLDGTLLIVGFTESMLRDDEAYQIGAELRALTAQAGGRCILLNFEGVTYLSSTMIGQIFALRNSCKAKDTGVKICGMAPAVRDVIEIVQLPRVVDVYDDEAAAREALEGEFDVATDDTDAASLNELKKQAEAGDAEAQYKLGKCLDEGRGVKQNSEEALAWYRKAAEQGQPDGQFMLGNSYAFGIHVEQDYDQALEWYRKAGKQGHHEAQYSLGMSYHYGIGVEEDEKKAANWYQKAAVFGHEPAQTGLSRLGVS